MSILTDSKEYIKMDMEYEHVGPEVIRSQEGKRSQDDDKRLCLVDDLKKAKDHIHIKSKIQMKEGYGNSDVTLYPTQVFSVNNWALKPNQPEEPPFRDHMLAICSAAKPMVFKAPKLSSNVERVSQGTKA
ncbi:hypothetical protein Tco_1348484 [Tanacetum coccineum]